MSAFTPCDLEEHIPERKPDEKPLIDHGMFTVLRKGRPASIALLFPYRASRV